MKSEFLAENFETMFRENYYQGVFLLSTTRKLDPEAECPEQFTAEENRLQKERAAAESRHREVLRLQEGRDGERIMLLRRQQQEKLRVLEQSKAAESC